MMLLVHTAAEPALDNRVRESSTDDAPRAPPSIAEITKYIEGGLLLKSCGIDPASISGDIDNWLHVGKQLAVQLGLNHDALDEAQRNRIYHYYLPVFFWCRNQVAAHKQAGKEHAMVIGISAPQGCGKSTLVEQLELLFNWSGSKAATVSIDDFYLSYQDQTALAAANPDNSLLQMRGNAGTHDLALGTATLQELRGLTSAGTSAAVPRYNKSAYSGRGDRADPSTWPKVEGPLDVVFFEGWMSGFKPLSDEQATAQDPALSAVNEHLRKYEQAWDSYVDSWLVIRIGDPQWVYRWRLQAEEKMRAEGKGGMTDEQVADFVSRFMSAYKAYLPGLYRDGPTTAHSGHVLMLEVDQNRVPIC